MTDSKLQELKAELDRLDEIANRAQEDCDDKYNEIVRHVGRCKLCFNYHYPHCQPRVQKVAP